ncbi:substrate-binding domain-containing protein [Halalkalibacter akibai]|uniref:Inositol transport system sugar-binding protein n=1 Tax=Halalkalibacter akibai (strain ATCC 43226 / DSM 21942 / CIP 109018 / JCM 9157 / 1139) TaxID=1236973 RepID=W4QVJ4_HALA3|nr:inositol transport system sugar-binding protein [Halalkalibacter akibai JCM 9157]
MKKFKKLAIASLAAGMFVLVGCNTEGTSNSSDERQTPNTSEITEEAKLEPIRINPSIDADAVIQSEGPHGETAVSASTLELTAEDIEKIREGNYSAALVMHYAGNDWSNAQINGLKTTFEKMGIEVITVTDAQFSAEKQVSDLETVMARNPDIIVSIPTDPVSTSSAFRRAAEQGIHLIFMDNVPSNLNHGEHYVSVVSADNYGNGIAAAEVMAEELGGEGKIGIVYHDADFFVTKQRTEAFEATIQEKYPNIEIVARSGISVLMMDCRSLQPCLRQILS